MSKVLRKFHFSAHDWNPVSRVTLDFQSSWLCDWWGDLAKKAKIRAGVWNIGIDCYSKTPRRSAPLTVGDSWEIPVQLDEELYARLSLGERKWALLDALRRGTAAVRMQLGRHYSRIADFEKSVLSNGLMYQKHIDTRSSADRKHRAELYCLCDIDSYRLCVAVRSGSACERPVLVHIEAPSEILMSKHLGRIRWESKNRLSVLNHADQIVVTLCVRPNGVVDPAA
jgi:hypothetical protein